MQFPFPSIPNASPAASRDAVMFWQVRLLMRAEGLLGPRTASWGLYTHEFAPTGPFVRHTLDGTGVWLVLSMQASEKWLAAVMELAHETVHLLDPVVGNAKIYEEGVAILFALEVGREVFGEPGYTAGLMNTLQHPQYEEALTLVTRLGRDALLKAGEVREKCGGLSQVTVEGMRAIYPDVEEFTLQRLCEEFSGRTI